MYYVVCFLIGVVVGGICLYLYIAEQHSKVKKREEAAEAKERGVVAAMSDFKIKEKDFELKVSEARVAEDALRKRQERFEKQIITYRELQAENNLLKRDLQNIDVNLNKIELDSEVRDQKQEEIDERSGQLAKRYLAETVKSVVASIGPSNYSACKRRLVEVIERCREIGFEVKTEEEERLLADLKKEFELAVRAEFERQEQARIKAQIREEERLKREIDRELQQLERERTAIKAALERVLAEARGQHSAEVEQLQTRLAEAEAKVQRTISMAEQTRAGHVYVISNIGTFGEGVFKVGMTRRLEPMERVYELGSASVPFPFDVHMMISCTDAPKLENAVHKALFKSRINRANPRKEFFKSDIDTILKVVKQNHGEVQYVADAAALEYRQSIAMPEEDAEFIEGVYDALEDDDKSTADN